MWVAGVLFAAGMAGIFCFSRGIAYFTHHRSPVTGAVYLFAGLVLYAGGLTVGRWLRRRRHGQQG